MGDKAQELLVDEPNERVVRAVQPGGLSGRGIGAEVGVAGGGGEDREEEKVIGGADGVD